MPFRSAGPVRYWRPSVREAWQHRFLRNPGDELGPQLVAAVLSQRDSHLQNWRRRGKRLLTVGSVVQLARTGDVVWGAGLRTPELASVLPRNIELRAVRGPLTADAIRAKLGIDCRVFGDPGLLAPRLFGLQPRSAADAARRLEGHPRVLFLSHFADPRTPARGMEHRRMVGEPRTILHAIERADVVLASALHGIVLAEAMGVPTVWLGGLAREPEFKFLDYYAGTQRFQPRCSATFEGWLDALNEPPVFSESQLLDAFPMDCFRSKFHPWQRLKAEATRAQHALRFLS